MYENKGLSIGVTTTKTYLSVYSNSLSLGPLFMALKLIF